MTERSSTFPTVEHPWFDSSRAPLYVWTFPARFTDVELESALDAHRRWREVAAFDCAFVVDISLVQTANVRQRWIVARHLVEAAEHTRRHVVATAMVVPTIFHRAIMRGVFWIQPPPTPVHVTQDRAEALAHGDAALSRLPGADLVAP